MEITRILKELSTIEEGFLYCGYPDVILHQANVMKIVIETAKILELSEEETFWAAVNARLHDYSKKGWPDIMVWVQKEDPAFTEYHKGLIRYHPAASYAFLINDAKKRLVTTGDPVFEILCDEERLLPIKSHHERYDGVSVKTHPNAHYPGYPGDLSGNDIPLIARMIGGADTYEAIRAGREYRSTGIKDHEDAMEEIIAVSCNEVGPVVASALKHIPKSRLDEICLRTKEEVLQ